MKMTKREKVIKGLEQHANMECQSGREQLQSIICSYFQEDECIIKLCHDALELLKKQEPVKPKEVKLWYTEYACGYCDYKPVGRKDGYKMRFCPCCGRAVKWE